MATPIPPEERYRIIQEAITAKFETYTDREIAAYLKKAHGIECSQRTVRRIRRKLGCTKTVQLYQPKFSVSDGKIGALVRREMQNGLNEAAIASKLRSLGYAVTASDVAEICFRLRKVDEILDQGSKSQLSDEEIAARLQSEIGVRVSPHTVRKMRLHRGQVRERGGPRANAGRPAFSSSNKPKPQRRIGIGTVPFLSQCASAYECRPSQWNQFTGRWDKKECWVPKSGYVGSALRRVTIEPDPPRVKLTSSAMAWDALKRGSK